MNIFTFASLVFLWTLAVCVTVIGPILLVVHFLSKATGKITNSGAGTLHPFRGGRNEDDK
jgi:hypothetical protein